MSSAEPVQPVLPAAEALRLAEQARAAAQAPQVAPDWYGATIGVGFALYGIGLGYALWADLSWMAGVLGAGFAATSGALGAAVTRRGGVARGWTPGYGGPVTLAVLQVLAGGLAVAGLVYLLGGDARWICGAAGSAAGAMFWLAMVRLNARIRRESAAVV
ncbi:hypothetical protein [Kitasatospora sp. NPDC047058]|uniref:hypothetical protein n=1 Tax=Kitasatospora sp. NPDC047058 TaxID=3155620 RepID=UPI00340DDB4E